ncbi:MAG: PD-(D/E)XK nuclease family protein [Anaerolineae bacterium]|nr:PD-(D/E)XK nuclease family protein [Anaerolineae bacterium]
MPLPDTFVFSQSSLQDYDDCARRFQLRYLLGVRWPAAHDKPAIERERQMRLGLDFHHLVHQHVIGLPVDALSQTVAEGPLHCWWQAYLAFPPAHLPQTVRRAEVRLVAPLGIHRLTARYDLIAVESGERAVIVDWKTEQNRPRRIWLQQRWQTRLYPYLLLRAGAELNGGIALQAAQIEMVYWFANYPAQNERFAYDADQHDEIEQMLRNLIGEIETRASSTPENGTWPLTADTRQCRYCTYQTLCGRKADEDQEHEDNLEPVDDPFAFDLDLDQIAEIVF